jgi:activator of HSP90 ATPase
MTATGKNLLLSAWFPTTPGALYAAWLDPIAHSEMTGGHADISATEGSMFSSWEGYITGTILELEAGRRIAMQWRTTDFSDDDDDSLVEIVLVGEGGGVRLWLHHMEIPATQGDRYRTGWKDFYFGPMTDYFAAFLSA